MERKSDAKREGGMTQEFIELKGSRTLKLDGQRFGQLIALGPIARHKIRGIVWICQCDCGHETKAFARDLVKGNRRSCGCIHERISQFWIEKQAALETFAAAGMEASGIAKRLGTTKNAVIGRCHRTGVKLNPKNELPSRRAA